MTSHTESIIDENGIEILVSCQFEKSDSQIEEGHGMHEVGNMIYTELASVEIIISHIGINILPLLTNKQKEHIISLLTYGND